MQIRSFPLSSKVLSALALTGLASTAPAQQVVHTDSVPLMTTNWVDSVTIPRFDSGLGALQSIEFSLEANAQGSVQFESQDAQPATVTLNFVVGIALQRPDLSPLVVSTPTVQQIQNLAAFDGSLDFGGPSGGTIPNLNETTTEMATSPRPLSDLTLFSGPAGNPGTITLPVVATGQSQSSGAGNLTVLFMSMAGANVTVTYNFIVDCQPNGVSDADDISSGNSQDCNGNGIPDECEVPPDCNANGIPDECEPDCNSNGIPDDCDITAGTSQDVDMNGVPDECDPAMGCEERVQRQPGSLLLFPEYDNRDGVVSLLTVTNTNCDRTGNPFTDNINVEFKYIDKEGCDEFNRIETLTPCDTLTVIANTHNPDNGEGYVYVFARGYPGGPAVSYNHLIGQVLVVDGLDSFDYSVNAVSFQSPLAQGTETDVNGNGLRDLDGVEYSQAPDELLIPRFLAQCDSPMARICIESELLLINLTGGAQFLTTVDFLIYNDNEQQFSAEYTFNCWDNPRLLEISGLFGQEFLASTMDDDGEIFGAPYLESGWFRVDGALADSLAASIPDPAIYAVLVERIANYAAADLPFEYCSQSNGALLARNLFGDQ